MRVKTSNLNGLALNYAVALCEGGEGFIFDGITWGFMLKGKLKVMAKGWASSMVYCPGEDWATGGPILTRESISRTIDHSGLWIAYWTDDYTEGDEGKRWVQCDRSELIAGLRCYVASKLGEMIEIPKGIPS